MNEDAETYELAINKNILADHSDMCALVVLMNDVSNMSLLTYLQQEQSPRHWLPLQVY